MLNSLKEQIEIDKKVIQCNTQEDSIMTISLRLSEEDKKLIKDYVKINNISV